jgi:hypothetical protein
VGRVPAQLWAGRVDLRMERRRIRVGGTAALTCDVVTASVAVDNPQELDVDDEDSISSSISFLRSIPFVFLELGLGLSAASSSSRCFPASIPL